MWWITLLTGIGSLLATVVARILEYFGKRTAKVIIVKTVVIAAFVTVTGICVVALNATLSGLGSIVPPQLTQIASMFVPSNFSVCLGIIVSAHTIRWFYLWKMRFISMYLDSM